MLNTKTLKIGLRSSPLSVQQGKIIEGLLLQAGFNGQIDFMTFETKGDQLKNVSLQNVGGKGLFTLEIESALLEGKIDLAVHSLKDMALMAPKNLIICAYTEREDPRDCFVSPHFSRISDVPPQGIIGTASLRRKAFLKNKYSDLSVTLLRGNVGTRLKKLREEGIAGTILSYAGLRRLGLEGKTTQLFSVEELTPCPGQGVLAVQCHQSRADLIELGNQITHMNTLNHVLAERSLLKALGGNCQTPIGAFCTNVEEKVIALRGQLGHPVTGEIIEANATGSMKDPENLGKCVALKILEKLPVDLPTWLA